MTQREEGGEIKKISEIKGDGVIPRQKMIENTQCDGK